MAGTEDRTGIRRVEWMRGGKEGPNLGWSVKVGHLPARFRTGVERVASGHKRTRSTLSCVTSPRRRTSRPTGRFGVRSEEHTSELQSHVNLVCRLLLEKKKRM